MVGLLLTQSGTPLKVGVVGSSDIFGIRDDGKFISIEVKVGRDYLKPVQKNWSEMIQRYNGIWVEAHCLEDVEKILL